MNTVNPFEAPAQIDPGMPPPSPHGRPPLASRGDRFVAALFDGLVMMPAVIVGLVLVGIGGDEGSALFLAGTGVMILGILGVSIYQWYLISTTGQSLGKKWKGLKIIRQDGGEVDFVSGVLLRVWVVAMMGAIPFIGSFVGLIDPLLIFGEQQRCLHDLIAKTDVIDIGVGY